MITVISMPSNAYKSLARARKAQRIISVLDAALAASNIPPNSLAAVRHVTWAEPADFARAALIAGCRPPSPETVAAVVEFYRERAKVNEAIDTI